MLATEAAIPLLRTAEQVLVELRLRGAVAAQLPEPSWAICVCSGSGARGADLADTAAARAPEATRAELVADYARLAPTEPGSY